VILGDGAAEDRELSQMLGELMDKSNPPGKGDPGLHDRFLTKLEAHVQRAQAGSLAGLFRDAPQTDRTQPAGQAVHWLFALGDTLAANAYRCLAVLAADHEERGRALSEVDGAHLDTGHGVADCRRLAACLQETMRLWPTTPMLSRETTREVEWDGVKLQAGTQCLLVNTFNHRDSTRHEYADRFAPDEWLSGDAASSWTFNHLSHGPQGCPGSDLAIFVGVAVLAQVLHRHTPRLHAPNLSLKPPLPHSLDYFAIKLALDARDG
jgi:cytochrome P450